MQLEYKPKALEQLRVLNAALRKRIMDKMNFYASQENVRTFAKPLTGCNAYRFRVGDYRVVCDIDRDTITVLLVDKRDGVYKGL